MRRASFRIAGPCSARSGGRSCAVLSPSTESKLLARDFRESARPSQGGKFPDFSSRCSGCMDMGVDLGIMYFFYVFYFQCSVFAIFDGAGRVLNGAFAGTGNYSTLKALTLLRLCHELAPCIGFIVFLLRNISLARKQFFGSK